MEPRQRGSPSTNLWILFLILKVIGNGPLSCVNGCGAGVEMRQWKTAAFKGDRVKVLLKGEYRGLRGNHEAPFLVKFAFGKGTVIFTSYHHGHQMDEQEKQLLKYLVFSTVVARVEQELEIIQFKNQFSPAKSNLFSASQQSPKGARSEPRV